MSSKAIVVWDANGPVLDAEVSIARNIFATLTNKDGYSLDAVNQYPAAATYVKVFANGYKPYLYPVSLSDQNQNICCGSPAGPGDIALPPLSFKKPSRLSIINVKANFCNILDADGIPIFDAFISSLIASGNISKAEDWFVRLKASGATHMNVGLSIRYDENLGWAPTYPIPGIDLTQDLVQFANVLHIVEEHDFIPIIKLAFDGLQYDPVGWTYGWQWGMDNIQRIKDGLGEFVETCLWSTGFDGCFPVWTPDQTVQILRKMREVLGDNAQIDTEFSGPNSESWSYCHMGLGAGDWTPDRLGILDSFSMEALRFPVDTGEGLQEQATRLLGPACIKGPQQPYYLYALDKYIAINVFETVAYLFSRKQCDSSYAIEIANAAAAYGFSVFGNGLPGKG